MMSVTPIWRNWIPSRGRGEQEDAVKEALVLVKCDRCKSQIEDGDEKEVTMELNGLKYEFDLCELCDSEMREFLNWLPRPSNNKCEDCGRVYGTFQALSVHRSKQHGYVSPSKRPEALKVKNEPGPFKCPECSREFPTRQQIGTHRWAAHKQRGVTA